MSFYLWTGLLKLKTWLRSGYNIARMRFEILLSPEALQDIKLLDARQRAIVKDAIETH